MSKGTLSKGENLYEINTPGNILYVLSSGKLGIFQEYKTQTGEYNSEDIIGGLALLHQFCREETVTALTDSVLFILKRNDFKSIIEEYSILSLDEKKTFLLGVELFSKVLINYRWT